MALQLLLKITFRFKFPASKIMLRNSDFFTKFSFARGKLEVFQRHGKKKLLMSL